MDGGSKSTPATDTLASITQSLYNTTAPVTSSVVGSVMEGLKTGGIGSLMPLISNAISQSKSALSNTLSNSYYGSTLFGGARSPFTQANLQSTESQGAEQIAGIGPGMTMNWLQTMIPALFGQQSSAIQGLGGAANAQANTTSSANQAFAQILSKAIPATTFAFAAGGAACWIAEVLYGPTSTRTKLARWYVNTIWPKTWWGRVRLALYQRYGYTVARWLRVHPWGQPPMRWAFNRLVTHARRRCLDRY